MNRGRDGNGTIPSRKNSEVTFCICVKYERSLNSLIMDTLTETLTFTDLYLVADVPPVAFGMPTPKLINPSLRAFIPKKSVLTD
ncbi:hypothetical protein CEXT_331871 [Caerostris extrusa]|uniref:Uncharacterized protein n=1 Tax=Caerostris extrusa TaxID=172846 RepID=A0AAV4M386_CAEEX|nr:hypothetical protein CEXT_331871 [Caerostris extrusa]